MGGIIAPDTEDAGDWETLLLADHGQGRGDGCRKEILAHAMVMPWPQLSRNGVAGVAHPEFSWQ